MNTIELIEQLRKLDEVLLLELLDISSEELIDAFYDKILERDVFIRGQLSEV